MKIYVVTQGSYSCYHIVCATLEKEQAERAVKLFSTSYDEAQIEEFDSDDIKSIPDGTERWDIDIDAKDQSIRHCYHWDNDSRLFHTKIIFYKRGNYFCVSVNAIDKDHAIKIASDELAKYLAEKEGL